MNCERIGEERMKYEKPDIEVICLETPEVFVTISAGKGDGGGFGDDDETW